MLKHQASKGDAVVVYREFWATQQMQYHRLSHRVNNRTIFLLFLNVVLGDCDENVLKSRKAKTPYLLAILRSCCLCKVLNNSIHHKNSPSGFSPL